MKQGLLRAMENANQRDPNDPVIRYKDYDRTAGGEVPSTPLQLSECRVRRSRPACATGKSLRH